MEEEPEYTRPSFMPFLLLYHLDDGAIQFEDVIMPRRFLGEFGLRFENFILLLPLQDWYNGASQFENVVSAEEFSEKPMVPQVDFMCKANYPYQEVANDLLT